MQKFESEVDNMAQKRDYATKKKGKTEVYPFWNIEDIKNVVEWFEKQEDWDGYLITLLELLLGRRIGDTISMKWSDLYYENGKRKNEINTIEEQKTGKITNLPISNMVFEAIDIYLKNTNINPIVNFNNFIFKHPSKTDWIKRQDNDIYKANNIDLWCNFLNKDLSDKRKEKILSEFSKQNKYNSLGQYLYYVVEWEDVIKWHSDYYRKRLKKATDACNIEYAVSTHSLRKSLGYWIYKTHPYDPDCILTLQQLFNHSDVQTTMRYIGLTEKKKRMYLETHGEFIKSVLDGQSDTVVKNIPVISLKSDDFGKIIMAIINDTTKSDVEKYQIAINMANELRIA